MGTLEATKDLWAGAAAPEHGKNFSVFLTPGVQSLSRSLVLPLKCILLSCHFRWQQDWRLTQVHTPIFFIRSKKKKKADLAKFSKGPGTYIKVLKELTQVFEWGWKDIMLFLSQILTSTEMTAAL